MTQRRQQEGYSIMIIAALFVAFMVIAGSLLEGNVVSNQINRQAAARAQLGALERALIMYSLSNNGRYPCPAKENLAYSNASFGTSGSCTTWPMPAGLESVPLNTLADDNVRGIVPVRDLVTYGVTIDDAFDPWGNRIMYTVNKQLTPGGSGTAGTRPTLQDYVTGENLGSQDFVLVSYGPDHVGGIVKAQTGTPAATVNCVNDSNPRTRNCIATITFYRGPINANASVATANYFDDIAVGYAAGVDCAATAETWTVGGVTCGVTTPIMPNGSTFSYNNTTTPATKVGTITLSCTNGELVQSEPHCVSYTAGTTLCSWVSYNDIWPNTTAACTGGPPNYSSQTACGGDATNGTNMLYATAAAEYTYQKATCRPAAACTWDSTTSISTAPMMQCRP